jgi:hypothetical protein
MMRQSGSRPRPGTHLIRLAERWCGPDMLEMVVSPIVADLQYEDTQTPAGSITRLAFRMRNCVGLLNAMCLHILMGRMRSMTITRFATSLRWLVMLPVAPLAALSAQALVVPLAWRVLDGLSSRDPAWLDWTVWGSKCAASPFMGAAFVAAAWWIAPTRKFRASTTAMVVVAAWGGLLVTGTFYGMADGTQNWWLFVMGLSGISGGALTWYFARRSARRSVAAV